MLNAFFLKSKLLRMSGILLVILSFCIPAFSASLEALGIEQKKVTVNGVVLDDTREPLIGVSVLVKGSQQGTVTDLDGKYSITAPADGILVFSFVGMEKQEIPVKGRNNILVTMRSSSVALSDVVVIGYGKQSKAALTSAITKVDSKDMAISPTGNPMPREGNASPRFQETSPLIVPAHSFCQIFRAIFAFTSPASGAA